MSWLTDLPLLLSRLSTMSDLLRDQSALIREQNSLLREQIQALTHRPAQTPRPLNRQTIRSQPGQLASRPTRLRTEKDVEYVTAADRLALAEEEARKQTRQVPPSGDDLHPTNPPEGWHMEAIPPFKRVP